MRLRFEGRPRAGGALMDPNANLAEQREITNSILNGEAVQREDVMRLAELVQALDAWLESGGFLPKDWVKE